MLLFYSEPGCTCCRYGAAPANLYCAMCHVDYKYCVWVSACWCTYVHYDVHSSIWLHCNRLTPPLPSPLHCPFPFCPPVSLRCWRWHGQVVSSNQVWMGGRKRKGLQTSLACPTRRYMNGSAIAGKKKNWSSFERRGWHLPPARNGHLLHGNKVEAQARPTSLYVWKQPTWRVPRKVQSVPPQVKSPMTLVHLELALILAELNTYVHVRLT